MTDAVLVTGAGGYLGRLLVDELLERSDRPVWLWLHAADADALARRARLVEATLGPRAVGRVRILGGDLTSAEPFAQVAGAGIGAIIHAAAITRFNVDAPAAAAVNVAGTAKLIAFARLCPRLGALTYASTLYASGLSEGDVAEAPLADAGFANHYEASKWAAENALFGARDLPVRVLRLPTLVVDDEDGGIGQHNAFHNTLRLLRAGLLALMPGEAETPLYLGAGRFAARAAVRLTLDRTATGVYHVVHGASEALTLGALLARAFQHFACDPVFRARRLLPPPLCDRATFADVAGALGAVGGPLLVAALASLTPFAPQLYAAKRFDNRRLRAALPDEAPPAAAPLVGAALACLCAARAEGAA